MAPKPVGPRLRGLEKPPRAPDYVISEPGGGTAVGAPARPPPAARRTLTTVPRPRWSARRLPAPRPLPRRPRAARSPQHRPQPASLCHRVGNVTMCRARPRRPPLAAGPFICIPGGAEPASAARPLAAAPVALFT